LHLVLASTSPYRKALLEQLQLRFDCARPEADETPIEGEKVEDMVVRLAELKARAVQKDYPDALIIGSDQSAELNGSILTKPGNRENAIRQLQAASGQRITFHTGLCLLNTVTDEALLDVIPYTVKFRELGDQQIERYLQHDQPYHCAGSFKSEGLGITLFEYMEGSDPTALIGLPLIRLTSMLAQSGVELP